MKLVVDASGEVATVATPRGLERLRKYELVAPPLLRVESLSALHAVRWRAELNDDRALAMSDRLLTAPISIAEPDDLALEAWRVADEFGWAKTYDANYVALARLLGCRRVTLGARLRRGTARLGFVIGPTDL